MTKNTQDTVTLVRKKSIGDRVANAAKDAAFASVGAAVVGVVAPYVGGDSLVEAADGLMDDVTNTINNTIGAGTITKEAVATGAAATAIAGGAGLGIGAGEKYTDKITREMSVEPTGPAR